jgi:hypothetical protein
MGRAGFFKIGVIGTRQKRAGVFSSLNFRAK